MKTLKNNKGFTLIEIVIVIVIIAILAAMLVPSMLSWIDSANERTFLSACDSLETAIQTSASEQYAAGKGFVPDQAKVGELSNSTVAIATGTDPLPSVPTDGYAIKVVITNDNKLTGTIISDGTYQGRCESDGSWQVVGVEENFTNAAQ